MTSFTKEQALDILTKAEFERHVKFYSSFPEYLNLSDGVSKDEVRAALLADPKRYADRDEERAEPDWYDLDISNVEVVFEGETVDVKLVHETGGMDVGSNASMTFKIGDQFFKKEGYYASHYGYDWDGDFFEVKPVERVITGYEPV